MSEGGKEGGIGVIRQGFLPSDKISGLKDHQNIMSKPCRAGSEDA